MKGNRYYLVGTICGCIGIIANVVLIHITPEAAFLTPASERERVAALSFAGVGYLVAIISALRERSKRQ